MATEKGKSPRYYIKTYGCQMNENDSARIAELLESKGFQPVEENGGRWPQFKAALKQCSIILINTCVVRQHAEDKALGFIGALSKFKNSNLGLKIGVCGCMATNDQEELKKRFPFLDIVFGPKELGKLEELLTSPLLFPSPSKMERGAERMRGGVRFVTIMTGCDNFCSYCVVPYVRGREASRPMDEVLAEIQGLLELGVNEITLLGQNVNSYEHGLAELFNKIEKLVIRNSRFVIKFMTNHPRDLSDEIIEAVKECPHVAKDFHLPLQAGDDAVLKAMNRGYTVEYFRERVNKIKGSMPEATITTDFIVGFPGETEEQFQNTLERVREFRFNAVNMAAYSPRPRTAAALMPDQLPDDVKQERLRRLKAVVHEVAGKGSRGQRACPL
ncbi:MAG TPA: tRNA (N6-isopentenyl adenosine(37)-C2)-methylthiotransferase MiaB [Candidatus Omnitrophota bacterium]|nr:tRNA (N6-isopentenyl adenosine(37)-C2)-methylthiotransferase MiaB [Candidatus Omnitrophota bacterium]